MNRSPTDGKQLLRRDLDTGETREQLSQWSKIDQNSRFGWEPGEQLEKRRTNQLSIIV